MRPAGSKRAPSRKIIAEKHLPRPHPRTNASGGNTKPGGNRLEVAIGQGVQSQVKEQILFTDYVPETDLAALYTGAMCFVYPSYFEGFGIPPLEAMRCGTPTITGNRTCFPEIIGDGGLMVDPFDERAIGEAILKIFLDSKLRAELREKGIRRANLFEWKETARQTLRVYERVFNRTQNR